MTKYVLTAIHHDESKVTVEFEVDTLTKVLENFELFLKGVGFYFDGVVDIVENENIDYSDFDLQDTSYPHLYPLCPVCKLSKEQLGSNICYDENCPNMEKPK